jgi:KaiC/GvpD/RAD55 family RecA-like ATPase
VSDPKPDLSRLAALAGGVGLHEHYCLIYETEEEKFAAAVPYLRAGLKRGERCLYVADEDSRVAVLDALERAGTDVDRYLRTGALFIASSPEIFLENGRFDPDLALRSLSQATREEGVGEFSGLRTILGEMTWALERDVSPDTLIEFEAKVKAFSAITMSGVFANTTAIAFRRRSYWVSFVLTRLWFMAALSPRTPTTSRPTSY